MAAQPFFPVTPRKLQKSFIQTEEFGFRRMPVTNREYLMFICWNISVFGTSYPDYVLDLLPQSCINRDDLSSDDFQTLFNNSTGLLSNYILNVKYLDYPVTGLSRHQIATLLKWLSDRYNERILIVTGHINFNYLQKDEDCFVLEAYLADQYVGSTRNGKTMRWQDKLFLPSFRLPFGHEMSFVQLNTRNKTLFRKYKSGKSGFLEPWYHHFLKINETKQEITFNLIKDIKISAPAKEYRFNEALTNATLEWSSNYFQGTKYLDETPILEKTQYGQMDFMLIGNSSLGRPIVSPFYKYSNKALPPGQVYWVAYEHIIPLSSSPK
ncbi:MAG: hypothetical protein IPN76_19500 [Saprospiraceae bacterium]|nr:hypothetical protein [Saprospiraceae bacterium]